jgi:hypothetical protein
MDLRIDFRNPEQEIFFWSRKRNNRFGGGFGNGKTYVACQRAVVMLTTFSGYRMAFCRQVYKNLRATTMQTFFKICPKEFILTHDENFGLTVFINGSRIYWLHLDQMDEATAKGFEINSLVIDQAEEVEESIFLLMDARVGRWDKAIVPQPLLDQFPEWPRHKVYGQPLVLNYVDILDNPSDDEFHWVSRYFDDDSPERKSLSTHFSIVRKTDDNLNDAGTISQILTRDQAWIDKYYLGKKVISGGAVHYIPKECKINPDELSQEVWDELLKILRSKASLFKILDHGETSPTCCLWIACYNGIHIIFGEYYQPNEVISKHRQNIFDINSELVGEENWSLEVDVADPAIFKKGTGGQKNGNFWTVADEYADEEEITAPPIHWGPADNNELATRNRINELFRCVPKFRHPITTITNLLNIRNKVDLLPDLPSPGLYFLMSSINRWPYGVHQAVIETSRQKKKLLGEINGKKFYTEDRDESVPDHAYDCVRYYVAYHGVGLPIVHKKPPKRSFAYYNQVFKNKNNLINQG